MDHPPAPYSLALALAAPIARLQEHWIEVQCRDNQTFLPIRMLASDGTHGRRSLADVVLGLKCDRCGGRPLSVALVQDPARAHAGASQVGWRIVLLDRKGD